MNNNNSNQNTWYYEWEILHNNYETYERYALIIKLTAIILCCINLAFNLPLLVSSTALSILWLQEGIWKTYQNRISLRLLLVEQQYSNQQEQTAKPLQLYSSWQAQDSSSITLIKEYLGNSLKPTVMYPSIILILLNVAVALL